MQTKTMEFADKLKGMLEALPEGSSMVVGLTFPSPEQVEGEGDNVWLEHVVAYKGEHCAEALFGLMTDGELIEQGIVEQVIDHMAVSLEAEHGRPGQGDEGSEEEEQRTEPEVR